MPSVFKKTDPQPVKFAEANFTIAAPPGLESWGDTPCFRGHDHVISCWKFSLRDRLRLLLTGRIYFGVIGRSHPPMFIAVRSPWAGEKAKP